MKLDWKSIWLRKGNKDTNDLLVLNGYENTNIYPIIVAKKIQDVLGFDPKHTVADSVNEMMENITEHEDFSDSSYYNIETYKRFFEMERRNNHSRIL